MAPIPYGSLNFSSKEMIRYTPRIQLDTPVIPLGGVTLHDLLNRPLQQLTRRYPALATPSLLPSGLPEIMLKFAWLGYEQCNFSEYISLAGVKDHGHLAVNVAVALHALMQQASRVKPHTKTYAMGPGSLYTEQNLALLGLRQIHANVFVAELELQRRMS
ncbi:hypothetical protein BN946_scf184938.g34 [Trametes cinnabarina]|uniref:Uncharacterized protein n=1 Tax=Pycnoporus cinnabarinus TaxID=5643 RepID=A0A060S1E0_PYCCI|nr:hypothetical protein BN946_scf184938.g34 [Trametes cinnabarina]